MIIFAKVKLIGAKLIVIVILSNFAHVTDML